VIFIDTGAFVARFIAKDQYHQKANRAWKSLEREKERLTTSNFVLDETLTLLARRTSYSFAAERGEAIFASSILAILRPEASDEVAALALFRKLADQEVSFTDCVSFALMRRHRVTRAFTFDRHFETAGFTPWP
jgi:predicted nucleic acid-binding protein